MTSPVSIPIVVMVDEREQPVVSSAVQLIEGALKLSADGQITALNRFVEPADMPKVTGAASIYVTSLLPEVDNYDEAWPSVVARLHERYSSLSSQDNAVIFVCTILRHVVLREDADRLKRIRIRRLNLLAAEFSREFGIFVIDIDRGLAAIGARSLQTDYRLRGELAVAAAGKVMALAIISAGLDAFVSFEVQDAASAIVAATELKLAGGVAAAPDMLPSNILALADGRRRQVVATVVDTSDEKHASWLIKQLFSGRFGAKDAGEKLKHSIAQRGFRSTVQLTFSAIGRTLRGEK